MDEAPLSLICLHCNRDFIPSRVNQTYCQPKCKTRAADARRRIKYQEKLKQKSRDYYRENKGSWDTYRTNQQNKAESDPEYAQRVQEWNRKKDQTFHENHPGYNALKQEKTSGKERSGAKPFSSKTLMAASRLLTKEARMSETLQESTALLAAAQILTTTAMARMLKGKSSPLNLVSEDEED